MTKSEPDRQDGAPWRNFYGRRRGKTLRPSQVGYIAEDLGKLAVPNVSWEDNPNRDPIDPSSLFDGTRPVWLEIGFGGGEHMVHQALTHPHVGIIGCEPYINGVAMLLGKIRAANVHNLAIHPGDARDLFDILPQGSIDRAFLLYPDPWPKTRHHRRRFVNREFLDPLADVMKSGAILRIATDIEDYVRQSLQELIHHPEFTWLAQTADDWRKPWVDWHSTRYEQKALREGRTPHYLTFRRN
ncbi:MAG: tRNA (guanosine(46)-N7)-methyltransferase TrmB [Proteobacteria bacterium]|nr:tRNA (guanosine(46)-N7)-methyltransferase TrmB [Pseudomonadota bacterium]MDA1287794.1 tRNA (guanosine(46)-N7)-methyltransferase TrmB [Pseudomonadota bacterium]